MLKIYTISEVRDHYGVIYKLTSPSGKCYIGQSTHVRSRFNSYKSVNSIKDQDKIYKALTKYGVNNFLFEIIDIAENKIEIDNKEIFYIELYDSVKNGYNLQYGGGNGKSSEETKLKLSKSKKQLFLDNPELKRKYIERTIARNKLGHSEESRKKLSEARIKFYKDNPKAKEELIARNKRGISEESKQKMVNSLKERYKKYGHPRTGKTFSEESKALMRQAQIGRKLPESQKQNISKALKGLMVGKDAMPSKRYIFIDPNGVEHFVHGEFEKFIKEHNLSYVTCRNFMNKGKIPPSNKSILCKSKNGLTQTRINTTGWEIKNLGH